MGFRAGDLAVVAPHAQGFMVSSRHGQLVHSEKWIPDDPKLSSFGDEAAMTIASVKVQEGDTLDFILELDAEEASAWFIWAPVVSMDGIEWNATADFAGPAAGALSPWERYAHTLLISNEFLFLD